MSAQQQPGLFARLFGRKQPAHTPWERFREEHPVQSSQPQQDTGEMLVKFLREPAKIDKTHANKAHVGPITIGTLEEWWQRKRLPALPAPRQQTGAIRPVSEPLPYASPYASEPVRPVQHIERAQLERTTLREGEDEMPAWARRPEPEYLGAVPSRPLAPQGVEDDAPWLNSVARVQVWAEPERQSTGALDALAILAAQKPDEDTKEVPSVMRKRHTKESEG